jgi:hypothetical protein
MQQVGVLATERAAIGSLLSMAVVAIGIRHAIQHSKQCT